ncbi:MAG: MFS transporter [Candidatus Helarchaeota archaeon]
MEREKLSLGKKISFAIGNIGGLAINQSTVLLLYTYYFLYLGVPLSALEISLILVIYGVWDALNEPLIGHLSDFTRSKFGRRKPFIMLGIGPLVLFSFLIYTPPVNNSLLCLIYLSLILITYELFVTMVVTNWYSLFPELSLEQSERLSISRYLQIFGLVGLIIGLGIAPLIAGLFSEPIYGYSMMGLMIGLITAVSMIPTILFIKERKEYQVKKVEKLSFFKSITIAVKNRSFLFFILVQFLLQLSYALVVSSLPLFFEGILGLGSLEYSLLLLATFLSVLPSLFMWTKVADKYGTKKALMISMLCFCGAFLLSFIIVDIITALIVLLIAGIGLGGLMLFPTILLSDVIDEDQLKTKKRREGIYNGVSGVIVKLSSAISWGIIGIVLTFFGIQQSNLETSTLTLFQQFGLKSLISLIPIGIVLLGLLCLHFYPLAGEKLKTVKQKVKELNQELALQYKETKNSE